MGIFNLPPGYALALFVALATSTASAEPVIGGDVSSSEYKSEFSTPAEHYRAGQDVIDATSAGLLGEPSRFETKPRLDSSPEQLKNQTRAKAETSNAAVQPQETSTRIPDAPNEARDPDPLRSALRTMVNVQRGSTPAKEATSQPGQNNASQPQARAERDPLEIELNEDAKAALLDMKASAADVVRKVFNPKIDDSGRTSFSVAGIEGFQLESNGASLAVGLNGQQLGRINYETGSNSASPETARPSAQKYTDPNAMNPLRDLIEFIDAAIEHPMTWLIIGLIVLGRIAFSVASAKAARRHRIRTPSRQKAELAR